jgi:hypothetical protein
LTAGFGCEFGGAVPAVKVDLVASCSFKILITGDNSGLVETITDAVSVHSIKKSEYARRIAEGNLGNVTLLDHFVHVCVAWQSGVPSSVLILPFRHMANNTLDDSRVHNETLSSLWPGTAL